MTDNSGIARWPDRLAVFLPGLKAALPPGLALIGPSFISQDSFGEVQKLATTWTQFNLHPYPGGAPPEAQIKRSLAATRRFAGDQPVVATETGYQTALASRGTGTEQPPVSEQAEGIYIPRLFTSYFEVGIQRTFIYELLDERPDLAGRQPEDNFGLLRANFSPKPAFVALRNLLRDVDQSPGHGNRIGVGLQGPREGVHGFVLDRRDGSRIVALWRDGSVWDTTERRPRSLAPRHVRLAFGCAAHSVSVLRPSLSGNPVRSAEEVKTLPLTLRGDLILVNYR